MKNNWYVIRTEAGYATRMGMGPVEFGQKNWAYTFDSEAAARAFAEAYGLVDYEIEIF